MIMKVPLGQVALISMGSAPAGESYNDSGLGVPLIAGAGDYGEKYPKTKKWTTAPTRTTQAGDLIICVRATIGDLNWADKKYCLGRGVAGIRAKAGELDIGYAAHYLNAKKRDLAKLGTGSTFPAIRRSDLEEFSISLPPLSEQKRIAAILDKADAIRRKRQQTIKLADEFLRSAFLDMFGDPVTNPKGWDLKPIGLISLKVQDGNYGEKYPRSDELKPQGEVPFLTSACVGEGGKIVQNQIRYVSKRRNLELKKVCLSGSDILFTNRGANFGQTAIVPESLQGGNIGPQLTQIKLNRQIILPQVLLIILNHQGVRQELRSLNSGSAMNFLGLAATKAFRVYCPPISLQMNYLEMCQSAVKLNSNQEKGSNHSAVLFNSLTQLAFRGEL